MDYILTFLGGVLSGVFIGVIILAALTSIGSSEEIEEAYRRGIEDGKKIARKSL